MAQTPTYQVNSPAVGTVYYAPSPYWFVPNGGTTVTVTVQTFDANGNLQTTTSTTAYIHDQSSNQDKASFTYNGGNTTNVSSSNGTNGSDVFTPGGKVGSGVHHMKMYAVYTGHAYNQPPNAPSNLTPAAGSLVNSLTPTMGGNFTDPDAGNTLGQYQIQVYAGSNGSGSLLWDTGNVAANSSEISAAHFSRVYAGTALGFGSSYSWRARVADNSGAFGPFSGFVNFSTVQAPNAPTAVNPSGLQTSLTPAFSFGYSSPAAVGMQSYHYIIKAASNGATVYDSGTIALAQASGTTVSGTIPAGANLQNGQAYTFTVFATDTNGATGPSTISNFSVAAKPQESLTSPINNATVNTTTPTFAWAYSDPNFAQQSYQVKIFNAATSALIKDTGVVASAATSYLLSGTTIAFGTNIKWQVQVVDAAGIASGFSGFAFASVNNSPTVAITAPTNLSTISTNTPTFTWTYTASAGGQPQSSAQITLKDSNNNQVFQATQAGAGTSYVLPAGVIKSGITYQATVQVTDTASQTGQATNSFTLLYTAPADMQGQPLPSGKNYFKSPYLNVDAGGGTPQDWTVSGLGSGFPTGYSSIIDPNVPQPFAMGNGDGFASGAGKLTITDSSNGGNHGVGYSQVITVANTPWVPGSTTLALSAFVNFDVLTGGPTVFMTLKCLDAGFSTLVTYTSLNQADTAGAFARLLMQNLLLVAGTTSIQVTLRLVANNVGDTAVAWWYGAQLEAEPNLIATNAALNQGTVVATGWTSVVNGGAAATYSIDASITNTMAGGNGAQKIQLTSDAVVAPTIVADAYQDMPIAGTGFVPGVDSVIMAVQAKMLATVGTPRALAFLEFLDGSNAVIGSVVLSPPVTTNVFAVVATPATLIPANAVKFRAAFGIQNNANGDLGSAWFMDANLSNAASFNVDPNFIAGDLGPGYAFDGNGYSVRTQLPGNLPTVIANPGADTDPVSALGGSTTLNWDTSLADGRFTAYLVERRRQDQQTDDTAWALLATITNSSVGSYTDLTAGGDTVYQYGVRQQIQYTDGSVGVSTNRAIVAGSVAFSPAWYLVNSAGQIYNLRLNTVDPQRTFDWVESADYTQFLGRVGSARDAGPDLGYQISGLKAYFNSVWGDDVQATRRTLIQMQRLNQQWYLKDPAGLVVAVFLEGLHWDLIDSRSDQMLVVAFNFRQAQETFDY